MLVQFSILLCVRMGEIEKIQFNNALTEHKREHNAEAKSFYKGIFYCSALLYSVIDVER